MIMNEWLTLMLCPDKPRDPADPSPRDPGPDRPRPPMPIPTPDMPIGGPDGTNPPPIPPPW